MPRLQERKPRLGEVRCLRTVLRRGARGCHGLGATEPTTLLTNAPSLPTHVTGGASSALLSAAALHAMPGAQ